MVKSLFSVALWIVCLSVCLSGCRTKYVAVPEYHYTDSVQIKHIRDSLFFHDSVCVSVSARNDTIVKEVYRWRYAYKDRLVRDTVAVVRRDSVPYIVEKKVAEYRTRWYDKICRWVSVLFPLAVFAAWLMYQRGSFQGSTDDEIESM